MLKRFPKPTHLTPFKWRGFFIFSLGAVVLACLVAIVQVQHSIRHTETEYYHALQKTLAAREEWGRLMLEKMHLSAPARVEQIAQSRLQMTLDISPSRHNLETLYLQVPSHEPDVSTR